MQVSHNIIYERPLGHNQKNQILNLLSLQLIFQMCLYFKPTTIPTPTPGVHWGITLPLPYPGIYTRCIPQG